MAKKPQSRAAALRARHAAIVAMVEQATTPSERGNAENALRVHLERYGEPSAAPEPYLLFGGKERLENIGTTVWCHWKRLVPPLSAELWRSQAPDGKRVFMSCVRTRKAHWCTGCGLNFPNGSRLWRPIAYNGNYRMDRLCPTCFAPDPEAPLAIEDQQHEAP